MTRFRALAALALLPAWLGCGGSTSPVSRAPELPASESAAVVAAEPPPAMPLRPSQLGLVGIARAEALRATLGRALGANEIGKLERELDLPSGSLSGREGLQALGISPDGAVTVESFELDEGASNEVKRLRAIDRAAPDAEIGDALTLESRRVAEGWFLTRIRVPLERGSSARARLESMLARSRASRWQSPTNGTTVLGLHGSIFVLRDVPGALEVGIAVGHRDLEAKDARRAVSALATWGEGVLPDLGGYDSQVVIHPSVVADAGLWLGVARTVDAALGDGIEPDLSRRLLAQGFREATQAIRLGAPSGTSRYREVSVRQKGNAFALRSDLAEDAVSLDASAWASDGTTVVSPNARASVDENGALAFGWPFLPAMPGINPYRAGDALSAVREAGLAGWVLALSDAPFFVARVSLEGAEPIGRATLPFMRRFERLGVADVEGRPLYLGLLRANATDEQAACALAASDETCGKADRLPSSGVASIRGFFVGRRKLAGRWVVVASPKKELAEKGRVEVVAGPRPALGLVLDVGQELGIRQLGRYRIEVQMTPDRRSFQASCVPAP